MRRMLVLAGVLLAASPASAQTPAPAPGTEAACAGTVEAPASPDKPDPVQRVAELIAKSAGPYKQIALGIWETTYKGKNLPVIRVRIAAAQDGVFFIVPLFPRDKLALSQAFLLRIAEFNAEYDYVKLALDKTSLNIRLDTHAALLDVADVQRARRADGAGGRRSVRARSETCFRRRRHKSREAPMLKGFKEFVLRGNVLDLAIAVVIGGAFSAVVAAMVKDLLTPLIGAIVGKPDFSALVVTVNGSQFLMGDFLNAVISFLLVAAAIYFFVVAPMNALIARRRRGEAPADPTTKKCPECLSEVPIAARRCAFCTSALT